MDQLECIEIFFCTIIQKFGASDKALWKKSGEEKMFQQILSDRDVSDLMAKFHHS